ncbi:hypothetical protein ACFQHK_16340 [Halomarina ordinaria]|uniref:Thaumarchaeal output domain-containing protein n=1 Tax=Halomarina ordinaria TaxID=3033939 RepID=A0ABD5UI29_9EURY
MFDRLKRVAKLVVDPLRKDPDARRFQLSIPDAHTSTVDGDTGWGRRPPARVRCSRCGAGINQRNPHDDLDCPECVATFSYREFSRLELVYLRCPVCADRMRHGRRHPNVFDVPEWATCPGCQYHWEFGHSF